MTPNEPDAVLATMRAAGLSDAVLDDAPAAHGTAVLAGGEPMLVSPPFDPTGTGAVRTRAIYPTRELRLVTEPPTLVAELPDGRLLALSDPVAFAEFGQWAGTVLEPVTLVDLLVRSQGRRPLTLLIRTPRTAPTPAAEAVPGAGQALAAVEGPAVTAGDDGWTVHAASCTLDQPHAPTRLWLDNWSVTWNPARPLAWRQRPVADLGGR